MFNRKTVTLLAISLLITSVMCLIYGLFTGNENSVYNSLILIVCIVVILTMGLKNELKELKNNLFGK